jgi:hypothetical protein
MLCPMCRVRPLIAAFAVLAAAGCSSGGGGSAPTLPDEPPDSPTPTAKPVARLSLKLPAGWTRLADTDQSDSFHLVLSGRCSDDGAAQISGCRSIAVLGPSYVRPDAENGPPVQPYRLTETHAGQYQQDEGYACPADPELRAGTVKLGATLVRQATVKIGGHSAAFREWTVPCYTKNPDTGQPGTKTATAYTERDWYVADLNTLIVDEWKTSGLPKLLTKATWRLPKSPAQG